MEPRDLRLAGADGLSLHALEWSREGVGLLLLHGFGNEAHVWDDFAPHVAPYYRTLALDWRGHGDSDWDPEHRYDYPNHVADLEAVVAALGLERVVLVGHSMGGRVAMLYAGTHPDRLAGLVVVDSAPELDPRGTTRIRLETEQRREPVFASVAEYERVLAHNYPAARPEAIRRMASHGLRRRDDGRFELKMDAFYRGGGEAAARRPSEAEMEERERRLTAEMWDALRKVPCPVLVVRGAASDIVSADVADRMVDEVIPNATLAVVARAGHSVMTDNPEGFRDAVSAFVLGE